MCPYRASRLPVGASAERSDRSGRYSDPNVGASIALLRCRGLQVGERISRSEIDKKLEKCVCVCVCVCVSGCHHTCVSPETKADSHSLTREGCRTTPQGLAAGGAVSTLLCRDAAQIFERSHLPAPVLRLSVRVPWRRRCPAATAAPCPDVGRPWRIAPEAGVQPRHRQCARPSHASARLPSVLRHVHSSPPRAAMRSPALGALLGAGHGPQDVRCARTVVGRGSTMRASRACPPRVFLGGSALARQECALVLRAHGSWAAPPVSGWAARSG